jgi:uridine kinase
MQLIGIAGGSGSGKTTVVRNIMQHLSADDVGIISQDSYYKDNSHLTPEQRQLINFDHPESIEFDLLVKHLTLLKNGTAIDEPVYDYVTSTRQKATRHTVSKPVLMLEGILIFSDERIRNLCDIKVFVDAEPDERLLRIIRRDIEERQRTVKDVIARYAVVKEMHIQFIEPTKRFADIIIPHGGENKVGINMLVSTIKSRLSETAGV